MTKPWRVQWHVTTDGTVIRERARGDQEHQQLFWTFATTRPVTVEELDALSERSAHELRRVDRFSLLWWTGLLVFFGGISVLGGLFTEKVSGQFLPGLFVGFVVALGLSVPAFRLVMLVLPAVVEDDGVGSAERLWLDAGLTSMTGVTMKAAQARALVDAPGTTSGVVSWVERA